MSGFTLIGGQIGENNTKPTLVQIKKAIESLDAEKSNPFLVLETSDPINDSNFIQVLKIIDLENGNPSYFIEIQFNNSGSTEKFLQYQKKTKDVNDVKVLFEEYFIKKNTPDISNWKDKTLKIFGQEKMYEYFHLGDLCSQCVREKDDVIFQGHGIKHRNVIEGNTIFQTMGEALTLLAEIVNSAGKYGDAYFSNDKKRFFGDIIIPTKWPDQNSTIPKFLTYYHKDAIGVTALNNIGKQMYLKIIPINTANRLLPCLIMLIVEKLINNETYMEAAIDYFINQDYSYFIKLYELVYSKINNIKFQIFDGYDGYEDDDISFNLNDFHSFSAICRTFIENKKSLQ